MAIYTKTGIRQMLVSPYQPDRTESIGDNTKQASSADVNKAVKMSGNAVVVCADGDEIYGFIASVEAGSKNGFSQGGVACDVGRDAFATDEDGGLAIGDLVVAGTAVALGTAHPTNGPNVVEAAGTEAGIHQWQVIALEASTSTAGMQVLLRKV